MFLVENLTCVSKSEESRFLLKIKLSFSFCLKAFSDVSSVNINSKYDPGVLVSLDKLFLKYVFSSFFYLNIWDEL